MATLKKYDLTGKEVGEESIDDDFLEKKVNQQIVKDYIVALCKNARQWSANTKGRKEINKVKQKPQQQKGLGRARQGFLGAPQFRGGGVVFGPKPKFDQHIKINRKEKRFVIRSLLSERIKENKAYILDIKILDKPKTKIIFDFLKKLNLVNKRVLIIGNKTPEFTNVLRSVKNIQKKHCVFVSNVNGYELTLCQDIIIMNSALDDLKKILQKKAGE